MQKKPSVVMITTAKDAMTDGAGSGIMGEVAILPPLLAMYSMRIKV